MTNSTKQPGLNLALAFVALGAAASLARGGVVSGNLFQMDQRGDVVVEFLNSNAGATGSLYFVGSKGTDENDITYATSSDAFGLGQFLFSNKGTPSGTSVGIGQFDANDTLYFAYMITKGVNVAPTGTFARNDLVPDQDFFKTLSFSLTDTGSRSMVGVEDIFKRVGSDWDYNDMKFALSVTSVPTPGAGLLAAMGGAVAMRRKRRAIA
jgi:hypothetical protein